MKLNTEHNDREGIFLKSYYFYYFAVKIHLGLFPVVLREHSNARFNLMCTPSLAWPSSGPSHLTHKPREAGGLGLHALLQHHVGTAEMAC